MNNLPERLRNQKYNATPEEIYADSMEAADEIERLYGLRDRWAELIEEREAEIERLRQEYDQLQNRTSDQYDEQQAEIKQLELELEMSNEPGAFDEMERLEAEIERLRIERRTLPEYDDAISAISKENLRLEAEIEWVTEIKDLAIRDSMAEMDENEHLHAEIERLLALLKSHQVWSDKEIEMYQAVLEEER